MNGFGIYVDDDGVIYEGQFLADKKQKDRRHVVVTEATTEEEPLNNNVAEAKIPQEHDHLMSSHSGLKSEKCTI